MGDKEDVRNRLDIVDFIGQHVVLKPAGRNFKGLCPFHKEKSPSFMVSSERQTFKCFGCGAGGDIFSFYMLHEGLTFPETIKDLAEKAGVELTSFQPTQEFLVKESLLEIHRLAAQFYHYTLTKLAVGKKPLEYLDNRGVTPTQISDMQLGYAPDGWRSLSNFLITKKKYPVEDVEKTGLVIKSAHGWYDRFRGRIMFPLLDTRGNTVGFSGRVLPWTEDETSGKYINSPETELYHKSKLLYPLYHTKEAVRQKNSVVIVEGEFDVLSSLRAGVKNVVAVKGSALTEDQVKLLSRYCNTIILALDADTAGIAAAKRAIGVVQAAEMNIKVVELTEGKDPDELVKSEPKKWRHVVKQAVDIYDFFLNTAQRQHDVTTVDGKQAVAKEFIPLLNQIQNKIIQAHYIKKLAELLGVEAEVVEQEMSRQSKKDIIGRAPRDEATTQSKPVSRLHLLLEELLTLVIHYYLQVNLKVISTEDLPDTAVTKIITRAMAEQPKDIIEFAKGLPPELQQQFDDCFLREPEVYTDKQVTERFEEIISEVAKLTLRDRLSQLRHRLAQVQPDQRGHIEHQINDVLVRFRSYSGHE